MKPIAITVAALFIAAPAFAEDEMPSQIAIDAIMGKLAVMKCQMAPDDIEMEDGGYDLDDVICEGGKQYDITLDTDLNETGRRAE